jgi:G:T-mismatch repair DNA endonuclease (very short patch repair protein)
MATIIPLYLSGRSIVSIGGELGLGYAEVRLHLMRNKVKLRSGTEWAIRTGGPWKGTHLTSATRDKLRAAALRQFSTDEARSRHAEIAARQIAEGKTKKAYTLLEQEVAAILTGLGMKFEQQYRIGRFVFDFRIAQCPILVEAHGQFWHADPRFYDHDHLSIVQAHNVANDKKKLQAARVSGWQLTVVWEHDVWNSVESVRKNLADLCGEVVAAKLSPGRPRRAAGRAAHPPTAGSRG